jgi:hypothetical protein
MAVATLSVTLDLMVESAKSGRERRRSQSKKRKFRSAVSIAGTPQRRLHAMGAPVMLYVPHITNAEIGPMTNRVTSIYSREETTLAFIIVPVASHFLVRFDGEPLPPVYSCKLELTFEEQDRSPG